MLESGEGQGQTGYIFGATSQGDKNYSSCASFEFLDPSDSLTPCLETKRYHSHDPSRDNESDLRAY